MHADGRGHGAERVADGGQSGACPRGEVGIPPEPVDQWHRASMRCSSAATG
ncbi:MAG TPA: hypothetical protein VKV36_10445 [Acidimicrobiales bacterium]|nr:hypothetical protein [Acidimicrobiales bacterium]